MLWFYRINLGAVVVGAVLYSALGFLWYHPAVFGGRWMKALGKTREQLRTPAGASLVAIGCALVASFALAWIISRTHSWTAFRGAKCGAVVGVGLLGSAVLTDSLFARTPRALMAINLGYHLVALVLVGTLEGAWTS